LWLRALSRKKKFGKGKDLSAKVRLEKVKKRRRFKEEEKRAKKFF
jgi:hypothetical protein